MCTAIAKETSSRLVVLSGIPCCLSVEEVAAAIPKVTRENGWSEIFVGDLLPGIPQWASWLPSGEQHKVLAEQPPRVRGKRIFWYDVSEQYKAKYGMLHAIAELSFRGETVHFYEKQQVIRLAEYVHALQRNDERQLGDDASILHRVPQQFLRKSNRKTVYAKLCKILDELG